MWKMSNVWMEVGVNRMRGEYYLLPWKNDMFELRKGRSRIGKTRQPTRTRWLVGLVSLTRSSP